MAFAFNPDDGPPRLIRYVERGTLPGVGLWALYDERTNLLIIDKQWFDGLTEYEKRSTLRTHRPYIEEPTRHYAA